MGKIWFKKIRSRGDRDRKVRKVRKKGKRVHARVHVLFFCGRPKRTRIKTRERPHIRFSVYVNGAHHRRSMCLLSLPVEPSSRFTSNPIGSVCVTVARKTREMKRTTAKQHEPTESGGNKLVYSPQHSVATNSPVRAPGHLTTSFRRPFSYEMITRS